MSNPRLPADIRDGYSPLWEETQVLLRRMSRVGARSAAYTLMGIRLLRCPKSWRLIDKNVFRKIAELLLDTGHEDIWDDVNEELIDDDVNEQIIDDEL